MVIQNVWDIAETVLLWKFLVTQTYLRRQKKKKSNINRQTLQLNQLEKEEQTKPKDSRKKEIIKIRADINDLEAKKKPIEKVTSVITKSWFFENINKIDKC